MEKEIYGIIYCIRNEINNKIYFGQTIRKGGFDARYQNDFKNNIHNSHLKSSVEKYGIENFYIDKIFDIAYSSEELDKLEDVYIRLYKTHISKFGYNQRFGGNRGRHTERSKLKMSESLRIRYANFKHPMIGKKHSQESIEKMRKAQLGKKPTKESIEKGLITRAGYRHSEETKTKIGLGNKGIKHTLETKLKMSQNHADVSGCKNVMYGKKHTEETKKKMSENHDYKYGKDHALAKKIICVTTGKIFDTIKEGAEYYNMKSRSRIILCCKGKAFSSGNLKDGTKLKWMYYDEYINSKA